MTPTGRRPTRQLTLNSARPTAAMNALKVLISVYSCRPGMGSEPSVGWNSIRELAKYHRVWALTRPDNREAIASELDRQPIPGLSVIYCDLPAWLFGLKSGQQLHYYLWQLRAYFAARQLHRDIGFQLVHHVTYVTYSSPSFLALLPVPFVWGTVGGGESAPSPFWQDFSRRAKAYEFARNLARWLGERDPFVRLTAQKSALARATTDETANRLHRLGAPRVEVRSQLGLSAEELAQLGQFPPPSDSPVRFIGIGRLLHWKGFHLGLQGFAKADLPEDAEYWILGTGPERSSLEALSASLGIGDRVKFWNRLPREKTLEKLGQCSALIHPSLHESGGLVCLEAMAAARPVVCLDLGGPALQVTPDTGFKVAADTPDFAVKELADAMTRLAADPALRVRLGEAGRQRAREMFSWETKGRQLARVYDEIVHASAQPL